MELSEYIRRYSIATLIVDGEYDRYSTHLGIDESEWTILYALYPDHHLSQKRICEEWRIPSSTVNTTTMRFRDQGLIAIEKLPGSRREMHLFLTPKGKEEAERILQGIFQIAVPAHQRRSEHHLDVIGNPRQVVREVVSNLHLPTAGCHSIVHQ